MRDALGPYRGSFIVSGLGLRFVASGLGLRLVPSGLGVSFISLLMGIRLVASGRGLRFVPSGLGLRFVASGLGVSFISLLMGIRLVAWAGAHSGFSRSWISSSSSRLGLSAPLLVKTLDARDNSARPVFRLI